MRYAIHPNHTQFPFSTNLANASGHWGRFAAFGRTNDWRFLFACPQMVKRNRLVAGSISCFGLLIIRAFLSVRQKMADALTIQKMAVIFIGIFVFNLAL